MLRGLRRPGWLTGRWMATLNKHSVWNSPSYIVIMKESQMFALCYTLHISLY